MRASAFCETSLRPDARSRRSRRRARMRRRSPSCSGVRHALCRSGCKCSGRKAHLGLLVRQWGRLMMIKTRKDGTYVVARVSWYSTKR